MKLAFITVAASLLGAVLVAASSSADGQATTKLQDRAPTTERAETVRVVDGSPCIPAQGIACVEDPPDYGTRPTLAAAACALPTPGPGPLTLASRLSALETFIGIREEQLDIWRDYTDALYDMLRRPAVPTKAAEPPDALAQSAMLAACAAEQGRLADKLITAIEELRGKLTPDQFNRLKQAGPLMPSRLPGPAFGSRPFVTPTSFVPFGPFGPLGPFGPEEPGETDQIPPP